MPVHCVCQSRSPSYIQMPSPSTPGSKASSVLHLYSGSLSCVPHHSRYHTDENHVLVCLPTSIQSKPLEDRECSYLVQGHISYLARLREGSKPVQCGIKAVERKVAEFKAI